MHGAERVRRGNTRAAAVVDDREYLRNSFEAFLVEHRELVDQKHLHCNEFSYLWTGRLTEVELRVVFTIQLKHIMQSRGRNARLLNLYVGSSNPGDGSNYNNT